jgi:hypothetical protein
VTFDEVAAKVRAHGDCCLMRGGEVDVDFIAKLVIETVGLTVADDGQIVCAVGVAETMREWQPPGGLKRKARSYRNGKRAKR